MATVTTPIMTDATGQSIDGKLNSLLGKMDNLAAAFQPNASGIVYSNTTSGLTGDDVQKAIDEMAADVSEIKQSLSANYVFGNQVNIISYSSSSNMFKAPTDGYILVQTWNNDSPINLWIGVNSLSIPITNTTLKAFALFAKKGTSYWIGRTGTNNSAMFLPLVIEQ